MTDNIEQQISSINQQVVQYYQAGRYEEAIALAAQALDLSRRHLGEDHPATADSLNNRALLYLTQGDYERAELLYQRALAIREQKYGPDHPDVAQSLNNLAGLYRIQGCSVTITH